MCAGRLGRLNALLLLFVAAACGSDPPATDAGSDAGTDAGDRDGGPSSPPPAEAELPRLVPCPTGWREIDADGLPACDPWPPGGRSDCPDGHAHFVGTDGCAPVGAPCPSDDDYPVDLPASGVVFVRAGASSGDGSRDAPFATITEGMAAAADGDTVAIAKGRYEETLDVRRAVHLRGACAADTVVASPTGSTRPPVTLIGLPSGSVRDLSIECAGTTAMAVAMADVELSGLAIRGEVLDGVSVFGGSLRGSDIAVQGSRGFGLYASNGADTVFERVVLVGGDADWSALAAFDGSLEVRDVAVSHRPGSTSSAQRLTHSVADATLRISRAWISGAGPLSTLVDSSSTMEVTDAVLAGDGDATPGTTGALVFGGGRFALERVRVERAAAGPIFAGDPGTILELTDVAFRDVYGTAEIDGFGRAIDVETGAHCNLSRVLVERATETALLFTGAGATGTLADLTVRDTLPGEGGAEGRALQVQLEAIVSVARFRSTRQREVALIAAGAGARMELFDVVIEETLPRACCPGFGAGIGAGSYLDAQLRIERFSIRDNALAGVQIARNGGMDLSQGEIRNNPVGANVQVPGYEFTRLSDRVSYRENGINLDAEELPVPDP